jgi:serine/threonine-protein kinase
VDEPFDAGERYEDRGRIGLGGMAEIRRVFDRRLRRVVAMKVLRSDLAGTYRAAESFRAEAGIAGRLQHPGIVPIHDLGQLADGRPFLTMPEIRGRTFREVVAEVHAASERGEWGVGPTGIGFRRLIELLRQASETVAYAHRAGVVHRDLKPANLMVGDNGELLVLDWGIARSNDDTGDEPAIGGTPAYMAPEQSDLELPPTPRADVYALGAILHEILSGEPPYVGRTAFTVLRGAVGGLPRSPIAERTSLPVPEALVAVVERAIARDPAQRFADGGALAVALQRWLDGETRREEALVWVSRAIAHERELAMHTAAAAQSARAVAEAWADLEHGDATARQRAWDGEDALRLARGQAETAALRAELALNAAINTAPDFVRARELLATRYRADVSRAEAEHRENDVLRATTFLEAQVDALPEGPVRRSHLAFLVGTGAVTLHTDPPGAEVVLHRYVEERRRLVARPVGSAGHTPLEKAPLERGSWLLELRREGYHPVRYPVHITRQLHWDGVPPGDTAPLAIPLPPLGSLRPGEVYVPPGWFTAGGDAAAKNALPRSQVWVDGFVVDQHPVTNTEYIAFLDALVARGEVAQAERYAPRNYQGGGRLGDVIYQRTAAGGFACGPDPDGDVWQPDWPVVMIDWASALAYAGWRSAEDGLPWRILAELEWEKAARGVDGRSYPWGDTPEPAPWANMDNTGGSLARVGDYPLDESPYGVRGMAGNVADFTREEFVVRPPVPARVVPGPLAVDRFTTRGGSWGHAADAGRVASRGYCRVSRGLFGQGLRLARSWPADGAPSP